ncbi:MAG: tetratricopeptide repeat protein [Treponemataceae bacterium]|nr:tetratricopeptide repeat protein [Treponemataceae bacterium]
MDKCNSIFIPDKEKLAEAYEKRKPVLSAVLFGIENQLKSILKLASKPTYKSRVKSFPSYYKKILRVKPESMGKQDLPVITDLIGIRVICAFLEDIAEVEKQIVANFNIVEIERKGASRTFSEFGYESVHVLIKIPEKLTAASEVAAKIPDGLVCEIQIRTILQDAWAEVEHELVYKSEFSPFDLPLRRKLASMNASLTLADIIFQEIRDYQNKLNKEMDFRRSLFYEQADTLSRKEISESMKNENVPVFENRNSSLPYVHGTIDDMILEAIHAHNTGELEKAVGIYTMIITAQPQPNNIVLSVILKHRGMARFSQNKYKESLDDFLQSVEKDPKNFRSLYYIGIVYSIQGDDDKAIDYFSRSLEINEYQSHVYYRRALSKYRKCDFKAASDDLSKAQNLGLDNEDCKKLGEILSAKKELSM